MVDTSQWSLEQAAIGQAMTASGVVQNPTILQRSVGTEIVLYNPDTDEVHTLDAVGSLVWNMLAGPEPVSVDGLSAELAEQFAAPVDQVRRDLDQLLAGLKSAGLLQQ